MTSVSSVGAGYLAVCTFHLHTELVNSQLMTRLPLQECPPSQPRPWTSRYSILYATPRCPCLGHHYERDGGVAAAASYRPHQLNDQQMSGTLLQPLQAEISRKTVKTVPLKLSEYLDKNAFYNNEQTVYWIQLELVCKNV